MKTSRALITACLLAATTASCLPPQNRPVSEISPSPMLEAVTLRRDAMEKGLAGILDTDFKEGRRSYSTKAYIVAFPDGPFRLEVAGPMGSTYMIMASNGREVTVYYPGKGTAYISRTDESSINRYLPFPLPIGTDALPALIMGTAPGGYNLTETRGYLLESGERKLWTKSDGGGLEFSYLFKREPSPALRLVTAHGEGVDLKVTTRQAPPYLPESFTFNFKGTRITGDWESVAMFKGDKDALRLDLPESTSITDLRDRP